MDDQELLKMAAKAAVLPVEFEDEYGSLDVNGWWPCGRTDDGDVDAWWNPLEDDGDALRLAVKLRLMVTIYEGHNGTPDIEALPSRTNVMSVGIDDCLSVSELHGGDACFATRLAIVRAAAEIGRAAQ